MDDKQKKFLLAVARNAVVSAVKKHHLPPPQTSDPLLLEMRGCFVTLKNNGTLRGCIGNFIADRPLIEMIHNMAIAAATEDPRFLHEPITHKEAKKLDIEISVLSPLVKTDDPLSLQLGVDGIYIKKGFAAGCFLPQVATETGWTKEEFLSYCCEHKAGLAPDAWKDPKTIVYLFTAEVFGQEDF